METVLSTIVNTRNALYYRVIRVVATLGVTFFSNQRSKILTKLHRAADPLNESSPVQSTPERHQDFTHKQSENPADGGESEPEGVASDDGDDEADDSTEEYGITDGDMEQIAAFLEKPRHERSADDLRPSSEN